MRSGNLALLDLSETAFQSKRLCSEHFSEEDVKYVSKTGVKVFKDSALPMDYLKVSDSHEVADNERIDTDEEHVDSNIECDNSTSPKDLLIDLNLPLLIKEAHPLVINRDEPTCSTSENVHEDVVDDEKSIISQKDELIKKLQIELAAEKKKNNFLIESSERQQGKANDKVKDQIDNYQKIIKRKTKRINNLESKIKKSEEEADFYKNFKKLNQSVLAFFEMQVRHIKLKKWTDEEKQFAMSLFYKSPKAYCYLREEKQFALPCVSLIRRWVNELDLKPGKTDNLLELLKVKSRSMTSKERECVLIWDEMSIKEWLEYNSKKDLIEGYTDLGEHGRTPTVGNHVLVFMLRGRQHNWRQPISYYVSHNSVSGKNLEKLILDMLDYVEESGFVVQTMVCDLGSPNQLAIKKLQISEEKPFIERYNRKIYFNFDPPHLIKCLRNALKNHGLKSDNENISWGPIVELYEKEKDKPCKAAPKLTNDHINPNCFKLMNVRLATQIFSNSVSAALLAGHFTNSEPLIHPDCVATANFLKKVNDLFDCLNSRTPHDKNPYRRPLSDKNIQVIQYLKDSLEWIETWECTGTKNPPCFRGFALTIKSILMQWENIKQNDGLYLLTSHLNQDPIENLFAVLRSRGGHCQNPTAMQLRRNLQYSMTANLNSLSKVTNCEPDRSVPLLAMSESQSSTDLENCSANDDPLSVLQSQISIESHTVSDSNLLNNTSPDECCTSDCISHNDNLESFLMADDTDNNENEVHNEEEHECNANDSYCSNSEVLFDEEVDESIGNSAKDINSYEENLSVSSSSKSSLGNLSEKYDQIFCVPDDSSTPLDAAIKYVAGYVARKCIAKSKCCDCKSAMTRENLNFENNNDLLIFFKAYATINDNELGNLCVPSDDFNNVITSAVEVFHKQFPNYSHCKDIGKLLYEEITKVIQQNHQNFWNIDEPCKEHHQLVIKFFVRVHLFYKLKWMNHGMREDRKRKRNDIASNKPNPKLQKLSHV